MSRKFFDNFIFELKYRPKKIEDLILPEEIKSQFLTIIKNKKIPNLLLSGQAGIGKTTSAFCFVNELELSYKYINMSKNTGIDIIRNQVETFASTASFDGGKKVIIGDECDRLSQQALDSLKGIIDEFSNNCTFIFTSNSKYKLPDPIISRFQEIDFIIPKNKKKDMMSQTLKRLIEISKLENIEFEKKALMILIQTFFPDFRKCLNELQKISMQGSVTIESIKNNIISDIDDYFKALKEKNFTKIRTYVTNINDTKTFYTYIFRNLEKYISKENIAEAIIIISKYMFESAFSIDPEITLMACSMELVNLAFN